MRVASYVLLLAVAAVVLLLVALIIFAAVQTKVMIKRDDRSQKVTKRSQLRHIARHTALAHLYNDGIEAAARIKELEEISPWLKERDFEYFRKQYTSHLSRLNQQDRLAYDQLNDLKRLFKRESAVAQARHEIRD